MKYQVAIT